MKLQVMTSGAETPSARFRHRQYFEFLSGRFGMQVDDYCPAINNGARFGGQLGRIRTRYLLPLAACQVLLNLALRLPALAAQWRYDLVWLERSFLPGLEWLSFLLRRPYVVDLDDAVWLYNLAGARMTGFLVRRARGVIAGNETIAEWCRSRNANVRVIPTAIDCRRFQPGVPARPERFTIGWTGTSGNFRHLQLIEESLRHFLRGRPDARLVVMAERPPRLPVLPPSQLEFRRWSAENEATCIREFDVGIMPLVDDEASRAKCSFKMVQYMAAGKPVVVSPVGLNAEILGMGSVGIGATRAEEWIGALEAMYEDEERRRACGAEGRLLALRHFDTEVVATQIAGFLNECAAR